MRNISWLRLEGKDGSFPIIRNEFAGQIKSGSGNMMDICHHFKQHTE